MVEMREDNQSRIQYNRILLPNQLPFPRILKTSTATILTFDGSGLQFLIEEFISLGVIDIAVDPRSETARVIDTLPEILNKRLIIFSKVNRSIEKCDAIFAPLSEELNVKFHWP